MNIGDKVSFESRIEMREVEAGDLVFLSEIAGGERGVVESVSVKGNWITAVLDTGSVLKRTKGKAVRVLRTGKVESIMEIDAADVARGAAAGRLIGVEWKNLSGNGIVISFKFVALVRESRVTLLEEVAA